MFGWFRRAASPEPDPVAEVQATLDILNKQIKRLPSGIRPWTDWSGTYPEVILTRTRYSKERLS